jgi:hypothetical protein
MTMPCSLRGTNKEALQNPIVRTSIMSKFLAKNLLSNMPLVPTNKFFKSPLGLFFECCGIAKDVLVIIDKIEVFIDFHIYAILEFDILIGHPLENLIQEKPSYGGLDKKLETTAFANPIPCPEGPMVKQQSNHNPFEQVRFISPFVSPKLACETKCASSPSLEPEPCPSGYLNIILGKENFCAMDMPKAPTLETKKNSANEHENFSFEIPHVLCSLSKSPTFVLLSTSYTHENHNLLLLLLVHKLLRNMVVDAYVCHKYCRSYGCIVVLTLQLE